MHVRFIMRTMLVSQTLQILPWCHWGARLFEPIQETQDIQAKSLCICFASFDSIRCMIEFNQNDRMERVRLNTILIGEPHMTRSINWRRPCALGIDPRTVERNVPDCQATKQLRRLKIILLVEALHSRQAVLTVIGRKRTPDNAWNFVGIFYYKVPLRRHGVWQVRTTLIIDCSNECAGKHLLSKVKRAVDAYNSGSFREYETRAPNRSSFQLLGIAKWLLCLKILLHGCGLIHTALPQNFCEVSDALCMNEQSSRYLSW